MAKTGWKYTKQAPSKSSTNMLKRSAASSKLHRKSPKSGDKNMRTGETIKRLKMYDTGKAIRNKEGKVVGGQFMMKDRAGDRKITSATGRIAPDRRWFGNTRVVNPTELDKFREEMTDKASDPYSIVLKRKKLPMGLLQDAALAQQSGSLSKGLLASEPFERAFGSKSQRKRVKVEQLFTKRKRFKNDNEEAAVTDGGATIVTPPASSLDDDDNNEHNSYASLLSTAQSSQSTYTAINSSTSLVPWGKDVNLTPTSGLNVDYRLAKKDDLFLKGQSRRIWGEFFKVVDCSDVILHVIDARNVPGTRCTMVERHLAKNAKHKHLVFVLNKIDLVPNWVAKRWMGVLSAVRPTVAFHASMTHAFGKGALISLLRQFGKLHEDKKQISVGVVGYPNVGKSSVINTLISKKSCKVAPIPGETKIWQYITLFRNIFLIDCPGVVVDTAGDSESDSVLKSVVRSERLEDPEEFVEDILKKVKREHVAAQYGLPREGEGSWTTAEELLELIALKSGKLLKGGEPCLRSSAVRMINDFQRGSLPHYVAPPELKTEEETKMKKPLTVDGIEIKKQDLNKIGEENMKEDTSAAVADGDDELMDVAEDDVDETNVVDTKEHSSTVTDGNDNTKGVDENYGDENDQPDSESDDDDDAEDDNKPQVTVEDGDWDDEN